jgi:hypothetical protein
MEEILEVPAIIKRVIAKEPHPVGKIFEIL